MNQNFIVVTLLLITLIVYLFISAPPPLSDQENKRGTTYFIEEALQILAKENDTFRTLYTKKIVGQGKKIGLNFDENWEEKEVLAGPLPALFLRSTSKFLEKSKVPLGLFLGSDFPINSANKLEGKQAKLFKEIKITKKPQFFFDPELQRYVAMYPDFAVAKGCINCHNQHANSPKKDWKLGDVMGATTWTYPKKMVTYDELRRMILMYRQATQKTYDLYLKKISHFPKEKQPKIGKKWPKDGFYLPTAHCFMKKASELASPYTLLQLLERKK